MPSPDPNARGNRTLRPPREIAEGAVDRLCAYDAASAPSDYESTAERVAEFLREFVLIVGPRLATVALRAQSKDGDQRA
jgi:hypothetical protein